MSNPRCTTPGPDSDQDTSGSPRVNSTDSTGTKTPQFRCRTSLQSLQKGTASSTSGKRLEFPQGSSVTAPPQLQVSPSLTNDSPDLLSSDSPLLQTLSGANGSRVFSTLGEEELSNMLLPPTSQPIVAEVQHANANADACGDGEGVDHAAEEDGAEGVLIPQDIPNSKLLYVLTTAEGRDKIMKTIQFMSRLTICLLKADWIVPEAAGPTLHGWCLKLGRMIQATREGRAMFKIGRWIVTIFHVEVAISLLMCKLFPMLALRARLRAVRTENEEPSRRATLSQLAKEVLFGWREKVKGIKREEFSEDTKRRAAEQYDNFTHWQMIVVMTRCICSLIRNLLRDRLFIQSQRLFGAPLMGRAQRLHCQGLENKLWFAITVMDCMMNLTRLLDKGWWQNATNPDAVIECKCTQDVVEKRDAKRSEYAATSFINKKDNCFFPATDVDVGCPTPSTPSWFDAASPKLLPLICGKCLSVCVTQSTPQGSLREMPSTGAPLRVEARTPPINASSPVVMGLPSALRRLSALWWCVSQHHNLWNQVLLQLKYCCDVYLSTRYVFGNLAAGRLTYDPVGAGVDPLQQYLHTTATLAGLTSALVSLHRVYLSSSK